MDNPTETLAALNALCSENPWDVSILSNASAFLFESFGQINWTGFYLVRNGELLLGPFAGKPACTSIRPGCGVCGTALKENKTLNVPDVHLFPGHIACDSASNSELVIPLAVNGNIIGVLDTDSPLLNRFSSEDQMFWESAAKIIAHSLENCPFKVLIP